MPRYKNGKTSFRGKNSCKFCRKTLMKKDVDLHMFVCEKVPQEVFQPNAPLGGSSVSFGTTSNSSLTNPLLGAPEDR